MRSIIGSFGLAIQLIKERKEKKRNVKWKLWSRFAAPRSVHWAEREAKLSKMKIINKSSGKKRGGRKTSFNPQPSKIVGYFFLFIIRKINSSWRPADSLERRALDATPTISSIFSIFSAPFHRVRMGRYSSLLYSLCCTHYTEFLKSGTIRHASVFM